jgi:hypothetical protein
VLVAAKGDRICRERIEFWAELEAWAVAHGKTMVVVERGGVFFPPRHEGDTYTGPGSSRWRAASGTSSGGRIVRSCRRIMRDGYWVGRAPFGYAITGDRYRKTLVPATVWRCVGQYDNFGAEVEDTICAWPYPDGRAARRDHREITWSSGVRALLLA